MSTILYSTKEIGELLGIKPATLRTYRKRGRMPAPDAYFQRTPVWYEQTILDWVATRPLAGKRHQNQPAAIE